MWNRPEDLEEATRSSALYRHGHIDLDTNHSNAKPAPKAIHVALNRLHISRHAPAHIGTYALARGRLFLVAERTYPPRCRRGEERDPSSWVWEVCSFGRFSQSGYRKPSQLKLPDPPAYASTHGDSDAAAVKQ